MKREHSTPKRSWRPKVRWDVLLKDLSLFASLCLAQLIVRLTVRRQRQERAERLKLIKLVPPADNEVSHKVCVDN